MMIENLFSKNNNDDGNQIQKNDLDNNEGSTYPEDPEYQPHLKPITESLDDVDDEGK